MLSGRAAKLKRRAQLTARGVSDTSLKEELTASFGLPGVPFFVGVSADCLAGGAGPLPGGLELLHVAGELAACGVVLAYHINACLPGGADTDAGRCHALAHGWAAPQQALAIAGHPPGCSKRCNLAVSVHRGGEPVGLLALHLDLESARFCVVQAIHVVPLLRGLLLPARMWERARVCVAELVRDMRRPVRVVRFGLTLACGQSQQGAHFWIDRMGWDGTDHARQAAKEWVQGGQWKSGVYELWYDLVV